MTVDMRAAPTSTRPRVTTPLNVTVVSSMKFDSGEPFAGGMEAHSYDLATGLRRRGHLVEVLHGSRSYEEFHPSAIARADVASAPDEFVREHHAYLDAMIGLLERRDLDVIHANCVHHLPLTMAGALPAPMTMTLHSPPNPWLESAITIARERWERHVTVIAVSQHVATQWAHLDIHPLIVPNGVDVATWTEGPGGGGYAVWFGRIVPEKGTAQAIEAAHLAGLPIRLAGPRHDPRYFHDEVAPRLRPGDRWEGHLDRSALARLIGEAEVCVVSPTWDEPYGLVAAEAMATGTPVAAWARGGLVEFVDDRVGALAGPGDTDALAAAIRRAAGLDRDRVRRHAVERCALDTMIDGYERIFRQVAEGGGGRG